METGPGRVSPPRSPGGAPVPGADLAALLAPGGMGRPRLRSRRSTIASPRRCSARCAAWCGIRRCRRRSPRRSSSRSGGPPPGSMPGRGSPMAWVATIAHRRAVDRVRSEQRDSRTGPAQPPRHAIAYDEVAETVEDNLDRERVRRCLGALTELQREAVTLAYYGGYTYREVAGLLGVPAGTVNTRMRDGLIRLRDCWGRRDERWQPEPHTLAGAYAMDAWTARPGPVRAAPGHGARSAPGKWPGCARPPPGWPPRRRCGHRTLLKELLLADDRPDPATAPGDPRRLLGHRPAAMSWPRPARGWPGSARGCGHRAGAGRWPESPCWPRRPSGRAAPWRAASVPAAATGRPRRSPRC